MDAKPTPEESEKALDAKFDELDRSVVAMKKASASAIDEAEKFARTARNARPSKSDPSFRAIRPDLARVADATEGDLTSTFRALKQAL
jgi:hypothetical protein